MYYYQMYGLKVASEFEFPEIDPISAPDVVDLRIVGGILDEQFYEIINMDENDDADYYYLCQHQKAIVRKSEIGVFIIENGDTIRYRLTSDCNRESAKQILLFICIFLVGVQNNQIFIHGSCVQVGNTGVIISGLSGSGKSTITTELLLNGAGFVSDDMCPIIIKEGIPFVVPALPERKLCHDTALQYGYDVSKMKKVVNKRKDKYITREVSAYIKSPVALSTMVIIEPVEREDLHIREIKGNAKLRYVLENLFFSNAYSENGNAQAMLQQCLKIAQVVPIYYIERPKNKDTINDISLLIKQIAAKQTGLERISI